MLIIDGFLAGVFDSHEFERAYYALFYAFDDEGWPTGVYDSLIRVFEELDSTVWSDQRSSFDEEEFVKGRYNDRSAIEKKLGVEVETLRSYL